MIDMIISPIPDVFARATYLQGQLHHPKT